MPTYSPRKIFGSWNEGWALDLHSTSSTYLGHDEHGHPQFETHRTEIGELLFRLKYRSDETAVGELTDAAVRFMRTWKVKPTIIVPVPPTRTYRILQPVGRLASALGARLKIPVAANAIRKLKHFSELKNVYDAEERRRLLDGAFEVSVARIKGQKVLLLDDLFRSGATMNAIGERLSSAGAEAIYVLAFTQTRNRA